MVHFDAIALGITAIELIVMAVVTTINVRYYVTLIFRNVQIIIVFRVILTQDLCSVYIFVYIYIYYIYIYIHMSLSHTLFFYPFLSYIKVRYYAHPSVSRQVLVIVWCAW